MITHMEPLTYIGPTKIDCPEKCDVPEGATLTLVPKPRHVWSDVVVCPNEDCGRAFLIERGEQNQERQPE